MLRSPLLCLTIVLPWAVPAPAAGQQSRTSDMAPRVPTAPTARAAAGFRVHSITDISHEFTFYFDGRFASNYLLSSGTDARNWGTLYKCDLRSANLLVLQSGGTPCPYPPKDVEAVRAFLEEGAGVVVLGDHATFRDEKEYRLNDIARAFGAEFAAETAKEPLRAAPELEVDAGAQSDATSEVGAGARARRDAKGKAEAKAEAGSQGEGEALAPPPSVIPPLEARSDEIQTKRIRTYGSRTIRLVAPSDWQVLIQDAEGRAVLARRQIGKGSLLLASRALAGHQPDAKDPINAEWWRPLLRDIAKGKPVSPERPPDHKMPENRVSRGGLQIRYSDYLEPYADEIFKIYSECRPELERLLGVPPSPEMLTSLILLPTGGGGFSSGRDIGLGVWWGDFPQERYGMVELLGHEATHSWVLPFAEPMWNEGIATYAGILLGRRLGLTKEAEKTLKGWIDAARPHDPDMSVVDLAAHRGVPHEVRMAKPMWIFEELGKEKVDILASYFRAKRRLIDPLQVRDYTADDSVAVLSSAMGRDLFPWFRSIGVKVDRSRTKVTVQ